MIEQRQQENIVGAAEIVEEVREGEQGVSQSNMRFQPAGADLIKAHVALMEREVVLSKQGDVFRLVQHHYHRLQSWHDQHTGWRIQRSSTVIRLIRQLSAATPGYIYERLRDPRDFACLTWILWYAENRQLSGRGNDQQFLLSQLAEQIQEQSAQGSQEEAVFDFRRPADRYSIQRALHYLEGQAGVQLVDGQTREWVEQAGNADVLYEFTDVARSLVAALHPLFVEEIAGRLREPGSILRPTRLIGVKSAPLARAWRALLLGPALFKFDDEEAFQVLHARADIVANELSETFGWLLDVRRDYACVVRESGTASGPVSVLTPYGTNDQIALLLCTALKERITSGQWPAPDRYGCVRLTTEDMSELFYVVRERYGENWGSDARSKSSPSLLNDVQRKMRQVGMLRGPDSTGTLLILPLAARYSASYEKPAQEPQPARSKSKPKAKAAIKAKTLPGIK
ncbi:MAG: hypothetical protein NVSMB44_38140 [Ktedonobacteraceae bacterium]